MTLERVKVAVEKFTEAQKGIENVVTALENILQDGLKGNRAVSGTVESVVTAATRAFPIQLSPAVEKAQAVVDACSDQQLTATWILQATADGSLITLLQKLHSQPQILTAYDSTAPIRQPSTVQQLVELLQQIKDGIHQTPYDLYVQQQQQQQQQPQPQPALQIHIQTEQELQRHSHHSYGSSSSSQLHESHIQPSSSGPTIASGQVSSSSSSAIPAAEGSSSQQAAAGGGGGLSSTGKKLLLGAFGRKHSSQTSSSSSSSSSRVVSNRHQSSAVMGQQQQHQQQQTTDEGAETNCICVRVDVLNSSETLDTQQQQQQQQQVVALHIQVLHETAPTTTSSSSSKFLGAGAAGAVKGLLHGLQQSASHSFQHSAVAGQELTGAVAAAGGAVAAAISQPFAAVKGLASAATGRVGRKKGSSSSSSSRAHAGSAAAAAAADEASVKSPAACSGLRVPSLFKEQQEGAAGRNAGQLAAAAAAPELISCQTTTGDQLVQVHLVPAADGESKQLLHCVITVLDDIANEAGLAGVAAADCVTPTTPGSRASSPRGWGAKSLINRINSSVNRRSQELQQQQQQQSLSPGSAAAAAAAGGRANASVVDGEVLEGDMWSVLSKLRKNSSHKLAPDCGDGPAAAAAATAVVEPTAAQQLVEQGRQLQQQLLSKCKEVTAAAAATRDCLGDENEQLLELMELLKQLLDHGLKQASAAAGGAGGGSQGSSGFSMRLSSRRVDAFGVLQSLQQGSKHQPRLMLGADSISAMQAAKSASSAVKLDLWLRASLNEQLLGIRLSTLVSSPHALGQWYNHNALIQQQQQMQEILQQITELSGFKFALLVEVPAAAASSSSKGAVMEARKLLGGFSRSFAALRASSSSRSMAAAAQETAESQQSAASAEDTNNANSSSIPTFLWAALGSNSSSSSNNPSSAVSSSSAAAAPTSNASILKRSQRRLANILEVRVPHPDSAAVLSPDNSCALSPVSTPEDAVYAEWWSPNSSWQDVAAAAAAGSREGSLGGRDTSSDGFLVPDLSDSGDANVYFPPGASRSSSAASIGNRCAHTHAAAAAAAAAGSSRGVCAFQETATNATETGVTTAAAKQLEQELAAAMTAPLQVLLERSRQASGSGSSSSGGGGGKSAELHRSSSSSGWDAAVAAARARGRKGVGTTLGVCGTQQYVGRGVVGLQRRSRSPEAKWPAAATAAVCRTLASSGGEDGGAGAAAAAGGLTAEHEHWGASSSRKIRHVHKRSSSLNDLPELAALLELQG